MVRWLDNLRMRLLLICSVCHVLLHCAVIVDFHTANCWIRFLAHSLRSKSFRQHHIINDVIVLSFWWRYGKLSIAQCVGAVHTDVSYWACCYVLIRKLVATLQLPCQAVRYDDHNDYQNDDSNKSMCKNLSIPVSQRLSPTASGRLSQSLILSASM